MKLLRATRETQGRRKSDFHWTDEGELLRPGMVCDRDVREGPDGGCGCGRSLSGVKTAKSTTTFVVSEELITREEALAIFVGSIDDAGYGRDNSLGELALGVVLKIAAPWNTGTVLERRGPDLYLARETPHDH